MISRWDSIVNGIAHKTIYNVANTNLLCGNCGNVHLYWLQSYYKDGIYHMISYCPLCRSTCTLSVKIDNITFLPAFPEED